MSWLLDADVLSQPAKRSGDPGVVGWIESHRDDCYTSSIVIAQLALWVQLKHGRSRDAVQDWLTKLTHAMQGRILGFTTAVAYVWAAQEKNLRRIGRPMPVEDSYIAAIARRHNLTIVTGNSADFDRPGLKVFNPFTEVG
jgi:predicted nucleic acid-binding protein